MRRRIRTVVVVLSALVLTSMAFTELTAQEFHYKGGAVKGTQVKTNYLKTTISQSAAYVVLESSTLSVHVDAGEVDLFVFEFEADCSLDNTPPEDSNDWVSVQARLDGLFVDHWAATAFCSHRACPQTAWVVEAPARIPCRRVGPSG